jgi:hypothetical protein
VISTVTSALGLKLTEGGEKTEKFDLLNIPRDNSKDNGVSLFFLYYKGSEENLP